MGTVVGAIASAGCRPASRGDEVTSWLNPVALITGALFVATGAYLSAVFLVRDSRRFGAPEMKRSRTRSCRGPRDRRDRDAGMLIYRATRGSSSTA